MYLYLLENFNKDILSSFNPLSLLVSLLSWTFPSTSFIFFFPSSSQLCFFYIMSLLSKPIAHLSLLWGVSIAAVSFPFKYLILSLCAPNYWIFCLSLYLFLYRPSIFFFIEAPPPRRSPPLSLCLNVSHNATTSV